MIFKSVIFAGGRGSRLEEETKIIPKPLVKINKVPIILRIIERYIKFNVKEFYILTGYKSEKFLNFFKSQKVKILEKTNNEIKILYKKKILIYLIFTGLKAETNFRLFKIKNKFKKNENFFLTYGDGLSDINFYKEINHHLKSRKILTVSAVKPPARYGVLKISNKNTTFKEKVDTDNIWINGGFFICNQKIFNFINKKNVSFEYGVMSKISKINQLNAYKHTGTWIAIDTIRDKYNAEKLLKEYKI